MLLFFNQTSPFARKVRGSAIQEFGLNDVTLQADPWLNSQDFTDANPLSKVPAGVLADGTLVTESGTTVGPFMIATPPC